MVVAEAAEAAAGTTFNRHQLIRVLLLIKKAQSCLRITDISTHDFPALATQNGEKRSKEMFCKLNLIVNNNF